MRPWKAYLEYVGPYKRTDKQFMEPIPEELGVFAPVLKNQRQVYTDTEDITESKAYQPDYNYNLRMRRKVNYMDLPATPTPAQKTTTGKRDNNPSTPGTSLAQSFQDLNLAPPTPLSQASFLDTDMFPKGGPAETIVKQALMSFLDNISIHKYGRVEWNPTDKTFKIGTFVAKVDG